MENRSEYEQAKQHLEEMEKKRFIADFEEHRKEITDYSVRVVKGGKEFYYGVPVFEDGKLQGFNMMKFMKFYDETGCGFHAPDEPYTDQEGRKVFLSVDAYLKFYKEMEKKDTRFGVVWRQMQKEQVIEDMVLTNNPVSRTRNKLAKKIDAAAKKVGLNTQLEKKKMPKGIKEKEKAVSEFIKKITAGKTKD